MLTCSMRARYTSTPTPSVPSNFRRETLMTRDSSMRHTIIPPSSGEVSLLTLFFFNDTATTDIYTLSLHDALPISAHIRVGERLVQGEKEHGGRRLVRSGQVGVRSEDRDLVQRGIAESGVDTVLQQVLGHGVADVRVEPHPVEVVGGDMAVRQPWREPDALATRQQPVVGGRDVPSPCDEAGQPAKLDTADGGGDVVADQPAADLV